MATVERDISRKAPDKLFIDGEWVDAANRKTFAVRNPATGDVLAEIAEAGPSDIDRAVAAARRAFEDPKWRNLDANARGVLLWRLADAIERAPTI
jgi:phenylacetaldehyde dehydrogenase